MSAPSFDAQSLRGPTVWGILPWNGVGVGGRMMLPLSIPGLLHSPSVHDNFAFEVGADLLHWSYDYGVPGPNGGTYSWTEILAVGGVMWNFWFNDRFALYPKVELGYAFGWFSGADFAGRPGYATGSSSRAMPAASTSSPAVSRCAPSSAATASRPAPAGLF